MTKGIFITATGTDVGKTYISALITKAVRDYGENCGYYKPALSGAIIKDGKIIPGDCAYVIEKAGLQQDPLNCVSYVFKPAVSPHLAAKIENQTIKLSKIKDDFSKLKQQYDYLVVEGAGGIVCPFGLDNEKILLSDVIKTLKLDIIIVADSALGTINSTVLTVEYAKHRGININGIILNNYDENDIMQHDNKQAIESLTNLRVIATIPQNADKLLIKKQELLGLFKEI